MMDTQYFIHFTSSQPTTDP
ncbi:BnaC02g01800D [Brassica napus]|uniref:BnaC02g01800D protein n=1 Tax=Brassica napus TaxID=3708 RepID=A0A078FP14_BRANA|nr:BnaC02g01800D [Brassica napus]